MREKWYAFDTRTGIVPWTRVTEIIVIDKIRPEKWFKFTQIKGSEFHNWTTRIIWYKKFKWWLLEWGNKT